MKYLFSLYICLLSYQLIAQEVTFRHDQRYGFIENKGQWHREVLFQRHFEGGNLWIQQHRFFYHFQDYSELHEAHEASRNKKKTDKNPEDYRVKQAAFHLNFEGSNEVSVLEKEKPGSAYFSYFIGNNREKWASNVHAYGEATLKNLYDGIDLKLIEQQKNMKYEFHVAAGVPVSRIRMVYGGHSEIQINRRGELIVKTELGQVIEGKPYSYQIINGKIKEVSSKYRLRGNEVSFETGDYNPNYPLVIDPDLIFATYNGAQSDNFGMTATFGNDGSAYSGGTVFGNQFPLPDGATFNTTPSISAINGDYGITDVFITKYSADGSQMLWSAFLGGGDATQGTETVHSLICDENDNLYFFGITSSSDFPIVNGYLSTFSGGEGVFFVGNGVYCHAGTDIYAAKVSADGHQLLGSTYLGGTDNDGINYVKGTSNQSGLYHNYGDQFRGEIMLDKNKDVYIASCTYSDNFPGANGIINFRQGNQDGIICKLSNNLSNLLMMTYVGGTQNDACYSVKIAPDDWIVFAGGTTSTDIDNFYTLNGLNQFYLGGEADGLLGKISPDGVSSLQMTHIGTANYDQCYFVEVDQNNKIYTYGQSIGGQFPVTNAAFSNANSGQFIARLDENLSQLERSTIFGSGNNLSADISPSAFLIDLCGNIYVSGWGADFSLAPMTNMPVTSDAFQSTAPNGHDFYLMVMKREFDAILYATYMGGSQSFEHVDGGTSRYDKNGVVYQSVCGGCGGNSDFPTSPNAWSANNLSSNCNNLIFKFDFKIFGKADFTASDTLACSPLTLSFTNASVKAHEFEWDFGDGTGSTTEFNPVITYTNPGSYQVTLIINDTICPLRDTAVVNITITAPFQSQLIDDTVMCTVTPHTFVANSFGNADNFIWSSNSSFSDTLNSPLTDSTLTVTPSNSVSYYVKYLGPNCEVIDSVRIYSFPESVGISGGNTFCFDNDLTLTAFNNSPYPVTYQWSPNERLLTRPDSNQVVVNPANSGYVYLLTMSPSGCSALDSVLVTANQFTGTSINATASDTVVIQGTTVNLNATPYNPAFNYNWSPAAGLTHSDSINTNALVQQTTTYLVQVSDGACSTYDTVTVWCFNNLCAQPEIYVPNAFSPNQKGVNEVFYVRGPLITEILLRVYNRWGEMVFESTDKWVGWDGTFKGRPCDPDVYDYYLKVTCEDGFENIIKGNVTLLK